jgi:hypothetical protein
LLFDVFITVLGHVRHVLEEFFVALVAKNVVVEGSLNWFALQIDNSGLLLALYSVFEFLVDLFRESFVAENVSAEVLLHVPPVSRILAERCGVVVEHFFRGELASGEVPL